MSVSPLPERSRVSSSSGASPSLWDRVFDRVRRELGDAPGCHDFAHTLRVLKNAERIAAEEPGCDPDAVRFGALLHDVARPEELASGGKLCHAALGADKARRILEEEGVNVTVRRRLGSDVDASCGQLRRRMQIGTDRGEQKSSE